MPLINKILTTIKHYDMIQLYDRVIIGLSGGADSVFLTHMLHMLKERFCIELKAVHINHGLRGDEAKRDEDFSAALCEGLDIPFEAWRFDVKAVAARSKSSVEEAGRFLRYKAFEKAVWAWGGAKIAVAHNKNDLAETVIFNLCRGSGLAGVCGIPPVRLNIIRPLIDITRPEIEEFLNKNNIPFMEDSTNLDTRYSRNAIRHIVLPALKDNVNSNVIENIANFAKITKSEDEYLQGLAREAFEACRVASDSGLDISRLYSYANVIQRRVVSLALKYYAPFDDISYMNVENVLNLAQKTSGKIVQLKNGVHVSRSFGMLTFTKTPVTDDFYYDLSGGEPVFIKESNIYAQASSDYTEGAAPFFVSKNAKIAARNRRPGDRIYFSSIGGHKKLKDFFIEHKIPRELRQNVLLIACGNEVLRIIYEGMDIPAQTPPGNQSQNGNYKIYIKIFKRKEGETDSGTNSGQRTNQRRGYPKQAR